MPCKRAREGGVCGEAQIEARLRGQPELPGGPLLPSTRLVTNRGRRKALEQFLVSGMYRNELALRVTGEFRDDDAEFIELVSDIVAVASTRRSQLQIEQAPVVRG